MGAHVPATAAVPPHLAARGGGVGRHVAPSAMPGWSGPYDSFHYDLRCCPFLSRTEGGNG